MISSIVSRLVIESPASSTMAGDSTLSNPPPVSVSRTQYILNATFAAVIMSLIYYQLYVFRSMIYEALRLVFGTLYPAYASYKAVRTKNVKEYVKWMMYWIVFALFTCAETFTDVFLSFWFPFYYEIKIILVLWLLSPATKGSSILYRKFVHPTLSRREQEIDEYIARAKEQGYHTVLHLGSKGVNYATTVIMQTAIKGGGGLVNHLRKSYSLSDLSADKDVSDVNRNSKALPNIPDADMDEMDSTIDPRLMEAHHPRGYSPRRSASGGSQVDMYFPEVDVDVRQRRSRSREPSITLSHIRSSEDVSSGYSSSDQLYGHPGTKENLTASRDALVRTASVGSTRTRAKSSRGSTTSVSSKKSVPGEEGEPLDVTDNTSEGGDSCRVVPSVSSEVTLAETLSSESSPNVPAIPQALTVLPETCGLVWETLENSSQPIPEPVNETPEPTHVTSTTVEAIPIAFDTSCSAVDAPESQSLPLHDGPQASSTDAVQLPSVSEAAVSTEHELSMSTTADTLQSDSTDLVKTPAPFSLPEVATELQIEDKMTEPLYESMESLPLPLTSVSRTSSVSSNSSCQGGRAGKYHKPPAPSPPPRPRSADEGSLQASKLKHDGSILPKVFEGADTIAASTPNLNTSTEEKEAEAGAKVQSAVCARLVLKPGIVKTIPGSSGKSKSEIFLQSRPKKKTASPSAERKKIRLSPSQLKKKIFHEQPDAKQLHPQSPISRFLVSRKNQFGHFSSIFPFWHHKSGKDSQDHSRESSASPDGVTIDTTVSTMSIPDEEDVEGDLGDSSNPMHDTSKASSVKTHEPSSPKDESASHSNVNQEVSQSTVATNVPPVPKDQTKQSPQE